MISCSFFLILLYFYFKRKSNENNFYLFTKNYSLFYFVLKSGNKDNGQIVLLIFKNTFLFLKIEIIF